MSNVHALAVDLSHYIEDAHYLLTILNACSKAMPASPRLLSLMAEILDDIASRAVQLGAGNVLSLTCRAFSQVNLLHAPTVYVDPGSQNWDELLTPRVVAALQSRTSKLTIELWQPPKLGSRQYTQLLMHALDKLGSCAAVRACALNRGAEDVDSDSDSDSDNLWTLDCSPGLAQRLVESFPGLTALSLTSYIITCSGLASLLSHPQLSLQLQQLCLTGINILQPQQPGPGAVTLDNLFHGARLKQLTLNSITPEHLPNLQPLAQHLTQLQLRVYNHDLGDLGRLGLASLAGLQVLSIEGQPYQDSVPQLLQALPQLHTLHLPRTLVNGRQELDALLAATQLTNVQLMSMEGLAKPQAVAPCTWRQLKLTGRIDCATAACLPLHSLTQPLELRAFFVSAKQDSNALVEAAVCNLTQAGRLRVKMYAMGLDFEGCDDDKVCQEVRRLVAALRPLHHCSAEDITFYHLADLNKDTIALLAPLCQGCSWLRFKCGSVDPSLEFWRQLVQGIPTVRRVDFTDTLGTDGEAACTALRLMAEQPCSRCFDVYIDLPRGCSLPERCMAINKEFGRTNSTYAVAKFTVWFRATV
ncbi:hypothetical protein QJQ45_006642 [Haematococcus lacustris]|nr:hypothetical protein QJQ45_006642 [Haematococcus lacustris]